jgi:IS605 OrfB family transposase
LDGIRQIDRKESRQVNHLLHIMTTDFGVGGWEAGVNTIAIGDLTRIREQIDYGPTLNQRLHAWPYGKIVKMIEYKADLYGMEVVFISDVSRVWRGPEDQPRPSEWCDCRWRTHADVNGQQTLF